MKNWFVYIIETHKNRLYTGITTDIERRFKQHCGELPNGAKFFRSDKPKAIVYSERCNNRSEASVREAFIKKLARSQKDQLIKDGQNGRNKIHRRRKVQS